MASDESCGFMRCELVTSQLITCAVHNCFPQQQQQCQQQHTVVSSSSSSSISVSSNTQCLGSTFMQVAEIVLHATSTAYRQLPHLQLHPSQVALLFSVTWKIRPATGAVDECFDLIKSCLPACCVIYYAVCSNVCTCGGWHYLVTAMHGLCLCGCSGLVQRPGI